MNCFKKNGLTSKAKVNGSKTYRALLVFRAAKAESFDKLLENYSLEKIDFSTNLDVFTAA